MKTQILKLKLMIRSALSKGISPSKISLAICLGVYVGIFPVIGATTLLGIIVAKYLGLNHLIFQLCLQLAYPLHIAMLIPFIKAGRVLTGRGPYVFPENFHNIFHLNYSLSEITGVVLQQSYGVLSWILLLPLVFLPWMLVKKWVKG